MTKLFSELQPGDWIQFDFGFSCKTFYVTQNSPDLQQLSVCSTSWLASAAMSLSYQRVLSGSPIYLGHTQRRWWVFWNPELVAPFGRLMKWQPPAPIVIAVETEEWPEYVKL